MKKILLGIIAVTVTVIAIYSCKKNGENSSLFGQSESNHDLKALTVCNQALPSEISTDLTLTASTGYLISGCVKVKAGATLTIPAGTILMGQKTTRGTLIIERGAKIIANGTSGNPIIFTSDQAASSRNPGDWGGIVIAGKASNNSSTPSTNVVQTDRSCGSILAGATGGVVSDNDNSGSLSYIQIHYAGAAGAGDQYPAALLLAAVGNMTNINHIQITNSLKDGMVARGGAFNSNYIVNYDNFRNDIIFQEGYRGNLQFALSLRRNSSAHDAIGSNAFLIANNPQAAGNTPLTKAVISNASIIGPSYCGGTPNADFKYAVLFQDNSSGGVFNSLIAGWPIGLFLDKDRTVINANTGLLKFSNNTFVGFTSSITRYNFSTLDGLWDHPTGACVDQISDWIENPDNLSCANFGYQALNSGSGLSSTLCNNYCSSAPSFTLGTSSLNNSTYPVGSMLDVPFFEKTNKPRGSFNATTDWSLGWTNWCPYTTPYCM